MHQTFKLWTMLFLCMCALQARAQAQVDINKIVATSVAHQVVVIVSGIDYCAIKQPSARSSNMAAYEKLRSEHIDLIRKSEGTPEYLAVANAMKQQLATLTPPQQQEMDRFCARLPDIIREASPRLSKIRAMVPK